MTHPTQGTCPVCNGSGRVSAEGVAHKSVIYGYDAATDTLQCRNCGGQYQYGTPQGVVKLRPDGTPCAHEYSSANAGRCYTRYTCKHCGDVYHIDSRD